MRRTRPETGPDSAVLPVEQDSYLDPSFIIKMKLNTEDASLTTEPLGQWCSSLGFRTLRRNYKLRLQEELNKRILLPSSACHCHFKNNFPQINSVSLFTQRIKNKTSTVVAETNILYTVELSEASIDIIHIV